MDTTRMKIVQPDIWLHFSPILAIGMHAILYSSGKGAVEVGNAVVVWAIIGFIPLKSKAHVMVDWLECKPNVPNDTRIIPLTE